VIRVDLGDQQRHQWIHAVVAGVADDDVAGGGKGGLDVARHGGVEGGEHDLGPAAGHAGIDGHPACQIGYRSGQTPWRGC